LEGRREEEEEEQWEEIERNEYPSFITPHFEFPFIQLGVQAAKSCTRRHPSKWRMTDDYLKFWDPSLPDFKEVVGSFICISRKALSLTRVRLLLDF